MLEQIARFPRVRDRALFVGNPRTSCPHASAPACRDPRLVDEHFDFTGYVRLDPASRRTARRCAPSSATRPTSASASSPSAARASAAACCERVIARSPRRAAVPGCG
jgi:hypothetical protein